MITLGKSMHPICTGGIRGTRLQYITEGTPTRKSQIFDLRSSSLSYVSGLIVNQKRVEVGSDSDVTDDVSEQVTCEIWDSSWQKLTKTS